MAPTTPPTPDGIVSAAATVSIAPVDRTAGSGPGHNDRFTLSARAFANRWATRAPMPTARFLIGVAGALNGKLYAGGGLRPFDTEPVATVEEYDTATNGWAT